MTAPRSLQQGLDESGTTLARDELYTLFHQLNNQLGIILANAELLQGRAHDETARARAGQVVGSVLEALATARELRQRMHAAWSGVT
jgi:hypothetical protein